MVRSCRWLVASLLLVGATVAVAEKVEQMEIPRNAATIPDENKHHPERIKLFDEQCKKADYDLVFVGDSITHYFDAEVWNKYYGKRRALNYGVGYEQTANVLWRIERGHFDVIKPKLIVMMIGTNNTGGAGHKPEMIRDGVAAILQQFRKRLPDTKVLLLAIFPRGEKADDGGRQNNEAANKLIEKLADGKMIQFMDVGHVFLRPDGTMSKEIMGDYLHPTHHGYELEAEALEPKIAEMLGEEKKK